MTHRLGALLLGTAAALAASQAGCEFVPRDPRTPSGSGQVYFVHLGDFPHRLSEDLVSHYESKYGLEIRTLLPVSLEPSLIDRRRNQLVAEEAIGAIARTYEELAADPNTILIGLTQRDMFIAGKSWHFAFSYRQDGRFAIVSSARMHLGLAPGQEDVFNSRFRKMVTKNIGILYYHLPQSLNARSVLYMNVGGIQELDVMGEEF